MEPDFQQRVLIVEGDGHVKQTIASILKDEPVIPVFCDTGEAGIEQLKETPDQPPSVIISALHLNGMSGGDFLEHAKKIAPNSIRYLMAVYSEMETIVGTVNQIYVHRFFVKPFENKDFLTAVNNGLKLHHSILEHKQLLKTAKQQNAKLYDLNCELVEVKKKHSTTVQSLEKDISALNEEISHLDTKPTLSLKKLEEIIQTCVDSGEGVDVEKLEALFSFTVQTLFDRFEELAFRSGFEMTAPQGGPE